MANEPAVYSAAAIGAVLESVINEIQKVYKHDISSKSSDQNQTTTLMSAVDIELNFKSVTLAEKGLAIFGKDTKESVMEIRLATRVTPPP